MSSGAWILQTCDTLPWHVISSAGPVRRAMPKCRDGATGMRSLPARPVDEEMTTKGWQQPSTEPGVGVFGHRRLHAGLHRCWSDARGVDAADPDTVTVAADAGQLGSRSWVPLRPPARAPAPASASHQIPLDEVTKHSTTTRSRQKYETRDRSWSTRSAHREEASDRESSPETVFGRCYALPDPVQGLKASMTLP